MVPEVQLIGEEDISLEYEKRATGKTAKEPQPQEKDERILQVMDPLIGRCANGRDELQIGKVKVGFDGKKAFVKCHAYFEEQADGKKNAE